MVADVEAQTSGRTPDADETTSSPHQPTDGQLAVVPLPTGDTPLSTDFQNEPALLAPPNDTVEPFIYLSKMSPSCRVVSSDLNCMEKHDYDTEVAQTTLAQTTPLQIHNPDGVGSSEDSFFSSAISRIPLSSDPNPQPNDIVTNAIEIGGHQSAAIKFYIQDGPSLPTPDNSSELFSVPPEACLSGGALSSDLNCVEKHDYDIEKAQTTPLQIHNPDGVGSSEDNFFSSAISRIPLSSDSNPQPNDIETTAIEIGGLQSAVIKFHIQNGPSLPAPANSSELFSVPPEACLSGGALSSQPNYAEKHENHTQRTLATPVDIVFPDGSEPRIGCKEGDLSPGLPDGVTMASEGSASSGPPAPASEATSSSFSTPHQPCLQAPIPHTGGTQLSNDETQTTLVEPSSSTDLIEPAGHLSSLPGDIQPSSHPDSAPASEVTLPSFSMPRQPCYLQSPKSHTGEAQLSYDEIHTTLVGPTSSIGLIEPARRLPSLPHDIQPLSHSNSAPAREALDAYSEDHIRLQDYDPFDGSFPTATVNRGRYRGPNAMPVQYSPYESSQIRRSPVQDYYPNEPNYRLPRYRQGARYQGQRESSSASELTYNRWSYGGQYQGLEYDVSRPCRVSNQRQRYYPVNDIPDDRPLSRGGRDQGPDYHDSNSDNFDDVSQPFEIRHEEQICHRGNVESDDMPRSHARQYRRHDYWHGTNVLNDMRQPRRARYQQQSYCLDDRYLGEAPQPYESHYKRREDWPEERNCPVMSQPGHYQRQVNWLGNNIVDGVPSQLTSRYRGRESWSSNDDFADVQRTERGPSNFPGNDDFADMPRTEREPANFPGNDNFADVQRTERGPANFPGNDDFADVQRTERGPANFLSNDSIHKMASQREDRSRRPEFTEFKSQDTFPTNHELEYMHPRTQGGDFEGVYQTKADPDFQKDPHRGRKSCYRDYSFHRELQSQKDRCYDAGSASRDETTPQITGQNRATEEKSSSQAGDGVGCESGTLVCDNIVSVPNSLNVVIGERNQAGGRSGGRITGNRVLR